ncbi:dihydrofolate reductase family protein [Phenylobacterium terrae]|uniref:Dihydrofolate reductase family protein n=1 Tax=Phenylobacterium terrae TaxID=2665495 RepID=A0ABW4MYS1_9CAUL
MPDARPRVAIFNAQSVDGRLDGFQPDLGLFYELAAAMPQQAILSGSATLAAAAEAAGVDFAQDEAAPAASAASESADRPWLVIVDSAGRITRFDWLRTQPHWRDVLVIGSRATPGAHLDRLRRLGVRHHLLGADKVDLAAALALLASAYGVSSVRVDAGPGLNGALLRAGLVDEVQILLAPLLAGDHGQALRLAAGLEEGLELHSPRVAALRGDHVLLTYGVGAPVSSR